MMMKSFIFLVIFLAFLQKWCLSQKLILPLNAGDISLMKFSPNNKTLLTCSSISYMPYIGNKGMVWSLSSGKLLFELKGIINKVVDAIYSRDGKFILTASYQSAQVWDASSGNLQFDLVMRDSSVTSIAISHNSKLIAVGLLDAILIFDAKSGKKVKEYPIDSNHFAVKITFSPDDRYLVSGDINGYQTVFDLRILKIIFIIDDHNYVNSSLKFDSNVKTLSLLSKRGFLYKYKLSNASLLGSYEIQSDGLDEAQLSDDGCIIKTSTYEGVVKVIKNPTKKLLLSLSAIYNSLLSSNGKFLITVHNDTVDVIDTRFGNSVYKTVGQKGDSRSITISEDSRYLAIKNFFSNSLQVVDLLNGTKLFAIKAKAEEIDNITILEDQNILTTSLSSKLRVWNLGSAACLSTIDFLPKPIFSHKISYSPDKKSIAYVANDSLYVYDLISKNVVFNIPALKRSTSTVFSFDSKWVAVHNEFDSVQIFSLEDKKTKFDVIHSAKSQKIEFCPNGKNFVAISKNTINFWKLDTQKLQSQLKDSGEVSFVKFTNNGEGFLVASKTVKMIATESFKELYQLKIGYTPSTVVFSSDDKLLLTNQFDRSEVDVWDGKTGIHIGKLKPSRYFGHTAVTSMNFIKGTRSIVVAYDLGFVKIYDALTGYEVMSLDGHTGKTVAGVSYDSKYIITCSWDNTCKLWDASNGHQVYTFIPLDSLDYLVKLPTNYYKSSPSASKLLHYVSPGQKIITFEQLDVKYNRPDLVLQAVGNADTALIASYRKAYQKRIKKLGVDTTAFKNGFAVPECDFVNRDRIAYDQRQNKLQLLIHANDSTSPLDRFNVWVNEVPLYGLRGINLRNKNKRNFDTTLTINLSDSINIIEVSVRNIGGLESYRMPLQVNYLPAAPKNERTYFIGIGIDSFQDNTHNLQWSVKDIKDLTIKLKAKFREAIQIDTLFNENVSVLNVQALKQKLLSTSINDRVIVAYSGHGLLSDSFDYYLSTCDVNFQKPEQGGLSYEILEGLLDSIPARKRVMLLDACHSGEVDKEEMAHYKRVQAKLGAKGVKGTPLENTDSSRLGMKSSFELMQELFVNVGRSTGATVISAAAGTQFALEKNNLRNGVFTYSILEYMQSHPTITVSELKKYVNRRVSELTEGLQVPTARSENINYDWKVW